jgi:putative N6-adenine-specific DNA methylase
MLAAELGPLGARAIAPATGGVAFDGDLVLAYAANLWLRTANRGLVPLGEFACATPEELYANVRSIAWPEHLEPTMTLAVDANVRDSTITHSHFVALRTKDAIVDRIRDLRGARPSVDVARADVRVNVRLFRNRATVSLDASGRSLHERGYRKRTGPAPLKETLGAAVVLLTGWAPPAPLVDPMCGTGTFAIEAALAAGDVAPGLLAPEFGFQRWRDFRERAWQALLREARERRRAGLARLAKRPPGIFASDRDRLAIESARTNAVSAEVAEVIGFSCAALEQLSPPAETAGTVLLNPPYGERLGDRDALAPLYTTIGDVLKRRFAGWTAHVLTGDLKLAKAIGLRASRRLPLWNGPIECRLLTYQLY